MPEANVLNNLGPFASPPLDAVYEVTERAWAQYRAMLPVQNEEDPPAHFMSRRMMHISEMTSLAVRLNASWGLIHPTMSLLRDRYEQARFSWLARQPGGTEAEKYRLYFYSKTRSLLRNCPSRPASEWRGSSDRRPNGRPALFQRKRRRASKSGRTRISERWQKGETRCPR